MAQFKISSCLQLLLLLLLPLLLLLQLCCFTIVEARGSSRTPSIYRRYDADSVNKLVWEKLPQKVKRTGILSGEFFSTFLFRQRYEGVLNDTSSEEFLPLCVNYRDAIRTEHNSSISTSQWYYQNHTVYGVFACPLDGNYFRTWCCGNNDQEHCCGFWESPWRLAGVICGIIGGIAFIIFCIIWIGSSKWWKTLRGKSPANRNNSGNLQAMPATQVVGGSYSQQPGQYPGQPLGGQSPYPTNQQPGQYPGQPLGGQSPYPTNQQPGQYPGQPFSGQSPYPTNQQQAPAYPNPGFEAPYEFQHESGGDNAPPTYDPNWKVKQ